MEKVIFKSINFASEYKNESSNTTTYYFWCETEDGRKGQFSTNKREQTKFSIGTEYHVTIEKKVAKKSGNEYLFFDTVKDNEQFKGRKGKYTPYYEKPEVQARITAVAANTYAANFFKKKQELTIDLMPKIEMSFLDWILKLGEEPQTQLDRRSALEGAINVMDDKRFGITDSKTLFEYAEKLYTKFKN